MKKHSLAPATFALILILALALPAAPALAADDEQKPPRRTRIGLGAQLGPSYPGADSYSIRPLFDVARTRGDKPFEFEAPDESFGIGIVKGGGFEFGPAANFQGSRKPSDVGADLDKVKSTFEVGGFAQYAFSPSFRVRTEVLKGLGGHDGWTGQAGADYVARDGDTWLFSIGPRVTVSDAQYHRAYFGVTPAESVRTGLATFRPGGGVQAVGGTAGLIAQFSKRIGIYTYAKYDRLVGDAGRSPVVRVHGSRDQFSGGVALTYTFGKGVGK